MKPPQDTRPDLRVAREQARRIIEHHLGSRPRRVVARGGGLTNAVFEVNHSEGDFIVRLSNDPDKVKVFLKEQWAVAQAAEAGVPTAKVLEVGADIVGVPYMVLTKVEGQEATHHPERFAILREMGRLTAVIHSIGTSGFGTTFDWSGNVLSRRESWPEYLHGELQVTARLDLLERHGMLAARQIDHLRAVVRKMESWEPDPVLNHGDMRLKNVVVDEAGTITAVIDWELCSSNAAPYWDLSVALHDLSVDAKQEFLAGYGLNEERVREIAPILKCINVINYAPVVEQAIAARDAEAVESFRTRLTGALDLYLI